MFLRMFACFTTAVSVFESHDSTASAAAPSLAMIWPQPPTADSKQTAVLQVVLDDDIGDRVEDELNVSRVCGAGEVSVDLLEMTLRVPASVQGLEF